MRDYLKRSEEARKARKAAREAMIAAQKKAREDATKELDTWFEALHAEADAEFKELQRVKAAHAQWVEDKLMADMEEVMMFQQMENRERHDMMNEFKGFLTSQKPLKAALHLLALPEVEEYQRNATMKAEENEFRFLQRMFHEHGAALFRMEIERAERRVRRINLRLEDVQFAEMAQRAQLFPEYVISLHRAAHPFGPAIQAIKKYAETVAKRNQKRDAIRAVNNEIEFFSKRHTSDHSRLGKELTAIQVGARVTGEQSYRRVGDKAVTTSEFASKEPWVGVTNVPDIDQVLVGMDATPKKKEKTAALTAAQKAAHSDPHSARRGSSIGGSTFRSPARSSPARAAGAGSPRAGPKALELKTAGVFETFKDKNDEMQFLRMRHVIAQDFRALAKQGRYSGPFAHETEIHDRKMFYSAQDELQSIVQNYAATLVKNLRRMNNFCVTRNIPEQNHVTGEWIRYTPVDKAILATYPPCNDWRLLLRETERLQYATTNYKSELLKIIHQCVERGARLPAEHAVNAESPVDRVHAAYFHMRGHFEACKRCLFPMASKPTLIQLRLLWPRVQDSTLKDRCRECNTSVFTKGLDAVGVLPSKTFIATMDS